MECTSRSKNRQVDLNFDVDGPFGLPDLVTNLPPLPGVPGVHLMCVAHLDGYAISTADWKAATEAGVRVLPEPVAGAQEWQVWSYTPALVPSEPTVDPLSLTLSLQDNADDRVQIALDELQGKIPW